MAQRIKLRIASGARDPERFPIEDDALGESIFALAAGALARGLPRPTLLTLCADRVDQVDVVPLLERPRLETARMMAAFVGQEGVESAALAGTLQVRVGGPASRPMRALVVYVEWPDNRWWTAWPPVDAARQLLGEGPVVRKAVDGWPRPGGMGGWFAQARREDLRLVLERETPAAELVH